MPELYSSAEVIRTLEREGFGFVSQRGSHLEIDGRLPYPEGSEFIDAEKSWAGEAIARAADEGRPIVLVSADGSVRTLVASKTPATAD